MTRTLTVTLTLVIGTLGLSSTARAMPVVDLIWLATSGVGAGVGTDTILADPGDTLTLGVFVTLDPVDFVTGYGISLEFDADLEDELDLVGTTEFLPPGFHFNVTPGVEGTSESTAGSAGFVLTYEAASLGGVSGPIIFAIGEAVFTVTGNVNSNLGPDVSSGLFNPGFDGPPGGLPTTFNSAVVNSAPEPGTLSLLALGLLGLTLAGGRARR